MSSLNFEIWKEMIQRLNTISWVMYVFYHFFLWVDRIKMVAPFLFWTIFFFSYFGCWFFLRSSWYYLPSVASWSLSIRYMYLYATVAAAAVFIRLYKSNRFLFFYYFLCAILDGRDPLMSRQETPQSVWVFVYLRAELSQLRSYWWRLNRWWWWYYYLWNRRRRCFHYYTNIVKRANSERNR